MNLHIANDVAVVIGGARGLGRAIAEAFVAEGTAVAVVDRVTLRRKTTNLARAYLEYLYSPEAQEIIAKHSYRPRSQDVLKKHAALFPDVKMLTIEDFGIEPPTGFSVLSINEQGTFEFQLFFTQQ